MSGTAEIERQPLPDGWRWVKLGDVVEQDKITLKPNDELCSRLPYLSLEHVESGTGRINPLGKSKIASNTFKFDDRHVLYGKLRPYLNKVATPNFRGRCTTEIIPLLPVGTTRKYLAHFLRLPETVDYAMKGKTGSRMPRTDMRAFMDLPVPLPSLSEQERIVRILDHKLATIEKAKRAAEEQLEAVDALPGGYLREVMPSSESCLPTGWQRAKLGEFAPLVYGKSLRQKDRNSSGSVPVYGSNGIVGLHDVPWTEGPTVIVGRKGSAGKVRFSSRPCWPIDTTFYISDKDEATIKFTYYLLKSLGLDHMNTDSAVPGLNRNNAHSLTVMIPPLAERKRIARNLDLKLATVDKEKQAVEALMNSIDALSNVFLRQAFAGEL